MTIPAMMYWERSVESMSLPRFCHPQTTKIPLALLLREGLGGFWGISFVMPDLRSLPLACPVLDTGHVIRGHPGSLENTEFRLSPE